MIAKPENPQPSTNICQSCEIHEGTGELHSCPYDEDIHNDSEKHCNCCARCVYNCNNEI